MALDAGAIKVSGRSGFGQNVVAGSGEAPSVPAAGRQRAAAAHHEALWKVPFVLQSVRKNDAVSLMSKWPEQVVLTGDGAATVVSLANGGAPSGS